jgi:hypothetical protein
VTEEQFRDLDDRLARIEDAVSALRHIDLRSSEELSRQDWMVAIIEGIRLGIGDLAGPPTDNLLFEAIKQGVHGAIWQMVNTAPSMTAAFYESIEDGVRRAMEQVQTNRDGAA